MKRVLIISYYWPPSGGAGVQRWLKFSKYLPEFGWQPIIYTPENPEYPAIDESLLKDVPEGLEVLRQPIWEPYSWYKQLLGQKDKTIGAGFVSESKKPGFSQKVSVWVRGNFFIPDARKFWIKPSVAYLIKYLKENPVDAIVSTGPPHSMHMIALGVKKATGIKWIADFRDPWTNIDFYQELMLSKYADSKHRSMEREVLQTADQVLTIGNTMTEEMKVLGAHKVETLTNGFDEDDFPDSPVTVDEEFSISHIGTFSPSRNHEALWQALSELKSENPQFAKKLKIRTVGVVDHTVKDSLERYGLTENWEQIAYVPHQEVLDYQRRSRVLLVSVNNTPNAKGILPGKFFEYLASGRPILVVGPNDSDIADVIGKTGAGYVVEPTDLQGMKRAVLELYEANNDHSADKDRVNAFSRKELTKNLASDLNDLQG